MALSIVYIEFSPGLLQDSASLMKVYLSLYLSEHYIYLYVDHMAMISLVFLLLLCWLYKCFMTMSMYQSHHVFTCK